MQLTTAQIWERIHLAGIATPEQCRQWAKSVSESLGNSSNADPAAVIKELVQQDKLSPYQANVLYRGLAHPLQLGKLRVTRSLESQRGPFWYEGEDAASARWSAFPPKAVWMVAIPDEQLANPQLQEWPPSLQWAQQHCQAQSPHLDRWVSSSATLKHLYAVCESVPGLLLSELLQQGPLSTTQAHRMLRDVAMGLKFLHLHRLPHGHLSTHAVVWNEMRGFLLMRDPLFPPRSPYHAPTLSVLGGHQERLALAAPELILPDAQPSILSDLYALGCLWFRCLTGNWPVDPGPDASQTTWAKLHAQVPVVVPNKIPDIQKRCLLHLLAKKPTHRFQEIEHLLRALDQLVLAQTPEPTQPSNPKPIEATLPESTSAPPSAVANNPTPANPLKTKPVDPKPSTAIPTAPTISPTKPLATKPLATEPPATKPPATKPPATKPLAEKISQPESTHRPIKKKNNKKKASPKPFGPRKKAKRPVWFMPLIVTCSLLLFSVLLIVLRGNKQGLVNIESNPIPKAIPESILSNQTTTTNSGSKSDSTGIDPMLEYYNIKTEDPNAPWTPPSIGAPYSTEMLPAGLEALLILSPNCYLQSNNTSTEIAQWWKSLYPQDSLLTDLPTLSTESLLSLSIAWYAGESTGNYRKVYRIGWKEPKNLETLVPDIKSWSSQEIQTDNKKYRYWTKEQQGRLLALITDDFSTKSDQQVKRISIGTFDLLKPLLDSQGKSGPLRRQLDAVLQNTDSRADVTFLAAPSFLFVDGKQMFGDHSEKIQGLMRQVIDDRVQAILVRTHFEPQLYLEYRMFGNDIQSAPRDAIELKKKLNTLADSLESQWALQPAAAYWRAIANRFPQMLRSVNKYARSAAEDGQVVFNVYLPKEAASNLAIGSWMALQSPASSGPIKTTPANKPTTNTAKTIDEMLEGKISLKVEQESLEVVLQSIASELKESHTGGIETLPMAINGTAFQKDGITRNQQIRNFEYKDAPVGEVLTALCRRANPVTTVQQPNEKDQKVVWLILDDPNSPSKKKLDMTTRAWAQSNQATLPKVFVEQ